MDGHPFAQNSIGGQPARSLDGEQASLDQLRDLRRLGLDEAIEILRGTAGGFEPELVESSLDVRKPEDAVHFAVELADDEPRCNRARLVNF